MLWITFAVLLAVGLGWVAVVMIRDARELRAVRAVRNNISETDMEQILDLIERIGTAPHRGYIGLFRREREPNGRLSVALPNGLADFPWRGKTVEVTAAPKQAGALVKFGVHEPAVRADRRDEPEIRWVAVPTISVGQQQQRMQNIFSLDRYIRLSPALRDKLNKLYPKNSQLLLAQILSVDGRHHLSEPFYQLRCGVSPAWIQSPRFHKCRVCRRPMRLILQVPGALLSSRLAEGSFYLLGCPSHADQTASDEDWG